MPTEIFQSGSKGAIRFVEETVIGTTPASPAMTGMYFVSDSLASNTNTITSNIITSNRTTSDLINGADDINGDISIEYIIPNFDPILESLLGNSFSTVAGKTVNSASSKTLTLSNATGLVEGQFIKIAGSANAADNGIFKVDSIAGNDVTVDYKLGDTTWSAFIGAGGTVTGKFVTNGSERKSFTLEKAFSEAETYEVYRGLEIASVDFTVEPPIYYYCNY
jgi:hypothetical protein